MSEGFLVDLVALQKAADGVTETLDAMATRKVKDIDAPTSAFGHDGLAQAVQSFCDRWDGGVEHLAKDGGEVVDRLNRSVANYRKAEEKSLASVNGVLQSPAGPDPAAS